MSMVPALGKAIKRVSPLLAVPFAFPVAACASGGDLAATSMPTVVSLLEQRQLGTLPGFDRLGERLYAVVNGKILAGSEAFSITSQVPGGTSHVAFCWSLPFVAGEHIAALYVDPLDAEIAVYSWTFVLGDQDS